MKNKRKSNGIEDGARVTAKGGESISHGEILWSAEAGSSVERKRARVSMGNPVEDELHDVVLMTGVHQQGAASTNPETSMDIPDLGKLVVLVCDTNRESRQKTVELLRQCGYKVLMSSRGSVAFEMLEREYEKGLSVDVILKSHNPPSSSAVVFLEQLRSSRKDYKDILVIVYSDREDQLDKQAMAACLSLGAVDLWVKPLRINEVGNIWTRVWQQKHKDGSLQPGRGATRNGSGGTSQPSTKGSGKTNDASAASENDKLRTNGVKIEQEMENRHKHHHKHHKHHKHINVGVQSSHHPDAAMQSVGNGSSGKQSATPTVKNRPMGKRSSTRNVESNPTMEDAEVADALTFMKSQRSTDASGEDHHQQLQGTDQSKDVKQNETKTAQIKTVSGGSTQFMAKMPFISGHPALAVNYSQYPYPWLEGRQSPEESMKKHALDFQRAWLEWQQQYQQAMQMNYAMQGRGYMWPSMKPYPQSFNGWGQGSGIPPTMEKQKSSSVGGQSNLASTVSRDELVRLQAVKRYREKRNKRSVEASNKIRYKSRKILADARPRIRGQFVQIRKETMEDEGSSAKNKDYTMEDAETVPTVQDKASSEKKQEVPVDNSAKSRGGDTADRPSDSGSNSPQSHQ